MGWSLYAGFAYILSTLLLFFVTGWQNWSYVEYTVVTAGPVVIWSVRRALILYHEYWIKRNQDYLNALDKERTSTIDKLKEATKYDSTQELIEKYSSKPGTTKQTSSPQDVQSRKGGPQQGQQRVFTNPPPTANIPRGPPIPATANIPRGPPPTANIQHRPTAPPPPQPQPTEEFAPNAFDNAIIPAPAPIAPAAYGESTWYDRILDALLGDDETSSKNRFALICVSCKLVNGQAPPGAKTLEDVGKWRCSGCGAMNGVENRIERVVKESRKLPGHGVDGGSVREDKEDGRVAESSSEEDDAATVEFVKGKSKSRGERR